MVNEVFLNVIGSFVENAVCNRLCLLECREEKAVVGCTLVHQRVGKLKVNDNLFKLCEIVCPFAEIDRLIGRTVLLRQEILVLVVDLAKLEHEALLVGSRHVVALESSRDVFKAALEFFEPGVDVVALCICLGSDHQGKVSILTDCAVEHIHVNLVHHVEEDRDEVGVFTGGVEGVGRNAHAVVRVQRADEEELLCRSQLHVEVEHFLNVSDVLCRSLVGVQHVAVRILAVVLENVHDDVDILIEEGLEVGVAEERTAKRVVAAVNRAEVIDHIVEGVEAVLCADAEHTVQRQTLEKHLQHSVVGILAEEKIVREVDRHEVVVEELRGDDYEPIINLYSSIFVMTADTKLGIKDLDGLKAYGAGKTLKVAVNGVAGSEAFLAKALFKELGLKLELVSYNGANLALDAAAKGETQFAISHQSQAQASVEAKTLTPVVAFDKTGLKNGVFAGVKGVGEYGYTAYFRNRCFLLARKGTDPAVIKKIQNAYLRILSKPEIAELFGTMLIEIDPLEPATMDRHITDVIQIVKNNQ